MSAAAMVTPIRPDIADSEVVWLGPAGVAARVPGLTVENLAELRRTGKGPAYFKPTGERGKVIIYSAADVDAWVRSARHSTREQS